MGGLRTCSNCQTSKTLADFYRHAGRPLGRAYECKECMKRRVSEWARSPRGKARATENRRRYRQTERGRSTERARAQMSENRAKTAERRRAYLSTVRGRYAQFNQLLKRYYGITVEDWARLYNTQNRCCAGCMKPIEVDRSTHVDHCHRSGRVRGLLCVGCNLALGGVRDSVEVLLALARYLGEQNAKD